MAILGRARDRNGNTLLPLDGNKDWSGKPGFRRFEKAPEMRPNFQKKIS
jgi:hypothetical protein